MKEMRNPKYGYRGCCCWYQRHCQMSWSYQSLDMEQLKVTTIRPNLGTRGVIVYSVRGAISSFVVQSYQIFCLLYRCQTAFQGSIITIPMVWSHWNGPSVAARACKVTITVASSAMHLLMLNQHMGWSSLCHLLNLGQPLFNNSPLY